VHVHVLLDLVHDHVVMRSFPAECNIGELAGAVAVNQEDLGGQVGAVVAGETFDEVQDQVQERRRPARCDHVAVVDDHPLGRYVHRRIAPAQLVGAFLVTDSMPGTVEKGAEPAPDGPAAFPTGWFETTERMYAWLTS